MSLMDQINTKDEFIMVSTALLSRDTTNEEREKADKLLSKLYKTSQAWQICKEVLSEQGYDQVLFTAAKLLRVKMFYYFNELPESLYAEFFAFLISKT